MTNFSGENLNSSAGPQGERRDSASNKYKAYPEYKDSGIEWADSMPAHWNNVKLRWITKRYAGGTPSKTVEAYWENGTVPWLSSGEVNQGLITTASTYITEDAYNNSSAKWIPKNALVMALAGQGKTKGMVAQLGMEATCNQSMAAIIPNNADYSRFLFWWLTSNYQNIRNMAGGDLRDGLNLELIGDIGMPIPLDVEAMSIANFLDHETAKIDTLIEQQQKLIQLLKEKRQAVISHAVTKGLNPDAPMKDSGVEWLGEVPEHWEVTKLKYYATIQGGYAFNSDSFSTEGVQLLRIGNVYQNQLALDRQPVFVSPTFVTELSNFVVSKGDILMSLTGTLGKRDYGYAVHVEQDGPFLLNQRVAKVSPIAKKIDSGHLINILLSESYLSQLYSLPSGTKQANLSNDNVLNIFVALPPSKEEQTAISRYIYSQSNHFDDVISKGIAAIELMQERRTALISAAVTGKIDVRGWQAPSANQ